MASVTINAYVIGSLVRVDAAFKDDAGVAGDTTAAVIVHLPDGTVLSPAPTVAHDGVVGSGTYHATFPIAETKDQIGRWWYRWKGTGAIQAAAESYIRVPPSDFAS